MRDEDQAHRDAQQQQRGVGGPLLHGSLILAPISLFVAVYLATFVLVGYWLHHDVQWVALLSVTVATAVTIRIWDRGRFEIGFFVRPRLAVRECLLGIGFAALIITAADALIVLFSSVRHSWSGGFPLRALVAVFIPAALHEEIAFRGYAYQKIRTWSRGAAIATSSAVFAFLHGGNTGVSPLAIANIFIAGVLLALAYERYRRLWFPIGIHFAWNALSGPVLGFPVSGFVLPASLFRVTGRGAALVTGGAFGVEASVCMTFVEVAGIIWLATRVRKVLSPEC